MRPIGIAAALAGVIALGTMTFTSRTPAADPLAHEVVADVQSPPHVQRYGDGTIVLLGAATLVTADLDAAVRAFTINQGRARFVAPGEANTDISVVAKGHRVRGQGAVFDIEIADAAVLVTAISGSVTIEPGAGSAGIGLARGETVTLQPDGAPQRAPTRAAPDNGWPPARPSFDAVPLDDVARLANSFGKKPLRLATPDLGAMRVTGSFDVNDTASLARKLAAALGLQVTEGAGEIVLRRY